MAGLPQLPSGIAGLTVVRRLGQSPSSEVFLVADDAGDKRALKVLRGSAARDPRIRERWRREAQLLGEIRHPNLVRSYGALEVDGRPALLLEYIDGPNLRDKLREGPLGWEAAARIGVQIARALERLHRHGALHRDVKPHNVLLDPRRGAVLADLGLVRRREDPTLTRQGAALGSPAYMSPEQARDPSALGPEADVYSLGATLHHALSGTPPFLGSGVGEVIHRLMHEAPEPLPEHVPEPLARVLRAAMAKDPDARYARARDLATDLGRVLLGAPPRVVTRQRLRKRLRMAMGAVAVVLAVAAVPLLRSVFPATGAENPGDATGAEASAPPAPASPNTDEPRLAEPERPAARDAVETRFVGWATGYEQAYRRYLLQGRLRAALGEVQLMGVAPLPDDLQGEEFDRFQGLRNALVREARGFILAEAERAAARAEAILAQRMEQAERVLGDGELDLDGWIAGVEEAWRREDLGVEALPLRPGGADPRARLDAARARLERGLARRAVERAERFVPPKRARTSELLRAGRFAAAAAEWQEVDPAILGNSAAGRREKVRVEDLAALESRLLARLDERAGQPVRLELRGAALTGRLMARSASEPVHRLDTGARQVGIRMLDFDPLYLAEFLLVEEDRALRWSSAQLMWCQGRDDEALAGMEALAADRWAPEYDPAFWIEEWTTARGERAQAEPAARPDAADPAPQSPEQALAAEWRRLFPGASVEVVRGGVEIAWPETLWDPAGWSAVLKCDRHRWRLAAWRIEWQLEPGAIPPARVTWLRKMTFLQPSRRALPELRVGALGHSGLGLVPGARQSLEWAGGEVRLDTLEVGSLAFPRDSDRLELRGEASGRFGPVSVWVRIAPVP